MDFSLTVDSRVFALVKKVLEIKSVLLISNTFQSLSGKRDSNPRPSAWEADALPTELLPQTNDMNQRNRCA